MSLLEVRTEAFSEIERRWVRRSFIMHLVLLTVVLAGTVALMCTALWGSGTRSFGEMIFFGFVGLLAFGGIALFGYFSVALWKDLRTNTKVVVRGRITSVKHDFDSHGRHCSVRVGDRFIASEPLLSPVPGFICRAQVGDSVEISFLLSSSRTLYIKPL